MSFISVPLLLFQRQIVKITKNLQGSARARIDMDSDVEWRR
jgi:hypothetical protein